MSRERVIWLKCLHAAFPPAPTAAWKPEWPLLCSWENTTFTPGYVTAFPAFSSGVTLTFPPVFCHFCHVIVFSTLYVLACVPLLGTCLLQLSHDGWCWGWVCGRKVAPRGPEGITGCGRLGTPRRVPARAPEFPG